AAIGPALVALRVVVGALVAGRHRTGELDPLARDLGRRARDLTGDDERSGVRTGHLPKATPAGGEPKGAPPLDLGATGRDDRGMRHLTLALCLVSAACDGDATSSGASAPSEETSKEARDAD